MGTGKSTVAKLLAKRTRRRFFDTDKLIEKSVGKKISEIFADRGEAGFRDAESQVIGELASATASVIATGGGALLRRENVRALKERGFLICLQATPESIQRRLVRARNRPLLPDDPLQRLEGIEKLLAQRRERYALADLTIDVSDKTSKQAAEEILTRIDVE